jgi:hypothetical protein
MLPVTEGASAAISVVAAVESVGVATDVATDGVSGALACEAAMSGDVVWGRLLCSTAMPHAASPSGKQTVMANRLNIFLNFLYTMLCIMGITGITGIMACFCL